MAKNLPEEKAKQGRRGFPVLLVLVCGLLLAAAVWWAVEIYGQRIDEQQPVELEQSEDAPGDTGPSTQPAQ
ncbi:hypothetical protein L598_000200002070 [Mesorhizobium sp. J18]|uniref:hypothetical protein n=1 Tax=Mesorhizobium sp. J18 TaxID=935263 RepID=UPI001198DA32|nr:hypothetical protein [Mesorhizobium sp. J18]TWG98068.1 hypothetical protein L598_000200002070 [Mesorhizobium sp. J18]